jgi:cobalt-zinc-cadmium efflux system membrane fusion protein
MAVAVALVIAGGCESSSNATTNPSDSRKAEHAEGKTGHEGGSHSGEGHDEGKKGHKGGHEGGHRKVELTEKAQQRYGLQTKQARGGRLASHVSAPASVKHAANQKIEISPLVKGRISEMKVTVGDRVEKGQTLAVLRSIELGKARAAVQRAKSHHEIAKSNFQRVEGLREKGIVSERRHLEAKREFESAKAKLSAARSELQTYGVGGGSGPYYTLESEIAGRVIEQNASEGEVKGPSDSLFVVANTESVWVIGEVFERDISKVEKRMEATVTLEAYPSRTWRGTVDWVADTVDTETRNLQVRVELSNKDGSLRPGMFGAVHLEATHPDKVALVPVGAVQKVHGQQVVFVPGDKPRHYRAQPVETGEEGKGMIEIRSGLEPGDTYITKGAFDLRATLTASSRSGGHHH